MANCPSHVSGTSLQGMLYFIVTEPPSYWGDDSHDTRCTRGSLLKIPHDSTSGRFLALEGSGNLLVDKNYVRALDVIEYELLLAIKDHDKRLLVCNDSEWLREGKTLRNGSHVVVTAKRFASDVGLQGTVRYKGYISDQPELFFGVELCPQFRGEGATDGWFRGKQYFQTEEDSAMFVSLDRIRDMNSDSGARSIAPDADYIKDLPVMVGDRIVLIDDALAQPESGVVRWLGFLPDDNGHDDMPERKVNAGVEFDNAIGKGSGFYKQQRLFRTQDKHALLVPVLGLIRENELFSLPSHPRN